MSDQSAGDEPSDNEETRGTVVELRPPRWTNDLPAPPTDVKFAWSRERTELVGLTEGQITRLMLDSAAWQQVMRPILDELELERTRPGKEAPLYSSHELESVLLYQRVCGVLTFKEGRQRLGGDEPSAAEARQLLGFDYPRNGERRRGKKCQAVERFDGVPSQSTVSRHKKRFGEDQRAEAYEQLFAAFRDEHIRTPELQYAAREQAIDGSPILTHFTAPKIDSKTKKVTNAKEVTCADAGYVPPSAGVEKCGSGWNLITDVTDSGDPLCYVLPKLHGIESFEAAALLEGEYAEKIRPHLDPERIVILNADGNFTGSKMRMAARNQGMLENIHAVSHGDSETSREHAKTKNAKRYRIEGYPNWYANGHRELFCACGREAGKRVRLRRDGSVVTRLEGRCPKCGSITITSGQWRVARNPSRFVRCNPPVPTKNLSRKELKRRDWAFGNPLTWNAPESKAHGNARFGHNEGFHGAISNRFGLVAGKRWFRSHAQARTDVAMVYSIIHAISMEQRRRQREVRESQAPPLALAA